MEGTHYRTGRAMGKPKARLRGEKSLAFGPAHDIRRLWWPQGIFRTEASAWRRFRRWFGGEVEKAEVEPQ